jgi:hypothetical protein
MQEYNRIADQLQALNHDIEIRDFCSILTCSTCIPFEVDGIGEGNRSGGEELIDILKFKYKSI